MLRRDEREAVLGDLIESGEEVWAALFAVLGLVLRRETAVWKTWHPWVAAFALSVPCSFLLMGLSVSVSRALQNIFTWSPGLGNSSGSPWLSAIPQVLLLAGWSWTGGFVVGSLSRRTLWVSAACVFDSLYFLSCLAFGLSRCPHFACLSFFCRPCGEQTRDGRIGRIKRGIGDAVSHRCDLIDDFDSAYSWRALVESASLADRPGT